MILLFLAQEKYFLLLVLNLLSSNLDAAPALVLSEIIKKVLADLHKLFMNSCISLLPSFFFFFSPKLKGPTLLSFCSTAGNIDTFLELFLNK